MPPDPEAVRGPVGTFDTLPRHDGHASAPSTLEERIEHRACAFAVGKQLAAGFLVERDSELGKKRPGPRGRERLQSSGDRPR